MPPKLATRKQWTRKNMKCGAKVGTPSNMKTLILSEGQTKWQKVMSKRIEVGIFAENVVLWNSGSSIQTIEADIYLTLKDASDFTEEHKLILILPNR
ncbi:hypothetical protein CEXT_54231 [Caerostris extrusa]|uniref:Uncharacterized protein n=1 Tax=Caerostris extrusa TaxID=172846 RepID=A0AAV4SNL9_CAEEX|nr:hypothetical protein CEXT_54231 [Caerostris extrusa]